MSALSAERAERVTQEGSPATRNEELVHVFALSSPVTELAADAAIEHQGLPAERIRLLCARGYVPSFLEHRRAELPFGPRAMEPFPIWVPGGRRRIRRFDSFLDRLCEGRRFHYYTVNSRNRYQRVIASSPSCAGFSYLEVGLSSYRSRSEVDQLFPPRRADFFDRLMHGERLGTKAQYVDGYSHVYALGKDSFPGFDRRVELGEALASRGERYGASDGVERVIVFDGMSAHRKVSARAVEAALDRLLETLRARGHDSFHYKFHPAQLFAAEDRHFEGWLDRRAHDFSRTKLGADVVLEALAFARPQTQFFVGVSSLGIYAAQAGCQVESYAPWISQAEPAFERHVRALPEAFAARVNFLS